VEAATLRFYEQGIERTTLADIADEAGVPLGNVYYYFKTKDELVSAVVDEQVQVIEQTTSELERHRTPAARLKALVEVLASQAESIAQYGCPHGTLCTELHKHTGASPTAGTESGRLVQASIAWAERQFEEMGRRDAHDLALQMIGAYQGAAVLTQALNDPSVLRKEARRTERWIDSVASSTKSRGGG
jgi:TetR/AcrR family transcriptional regulator, transcriptional repressor for nem operon